MTWVEGLPPLNTEHCNSKFDVYYQCKDGRILRWYGGTTEEAAIDDANKTLAADREKPLYRFKSATIVETVISSKVVRHLPVSARRTGQTDAR